MSANATFIEWMRAARKLAGASQQDLATHIGVTQQIVAKIELGQRPVRLDEAEAELVRTRRLLAHIHNAVGMEIRRGQQ